MKYPNRIAALRNDAGLTQEQAADAMGMSLGGYRKLEYGERRLKAEQITAAARAFNVSEADVLLSNKTVAGMGYIGAGATIEPDFEQTPPEGLFTVELPFAVPEGLVAFEVKGDSMLPRYDDGDVVLVYVEQQRATEMLLGEEVAVRTTSGARYLKRLMRGSGGKRFNLESWNAKTIEDVTLEWIGEIYLTVRSGQIRRIESRERAAAQRREKIRRQETDGMEQLPFDGTNG